MKIVTSLFLSSPRRPAISLDTQLIGPHVLLRTGEPTQWHEWRHLREISYNFLAEWEPSWPHNALTYTFFCKQLRRQWREWRQGKTYAFQIFRHVNKKAETLVGGITLNNVQWGIDQKGMIGYWIGEPYARRGFMKEAASLVCDFAFNTLKLNHIEAGCLPRNEASQNLLRRLGFEESGFAKAYLQINGQWEDHILWRKKNPLPMPDSSRHV
jgi:[ribosomal protein S5]-alanine N-acetyltransferase